MKVEKNLRLSSGSQIPTIGFGTWQIFPNGRAKKATLSALQAGYQHIDTARIYGNEKGVGEAIRESSVNREAVFLTTKLWNSNQGYDEAHKAFETSLSRLGLEYVDLYLIHWPVSGKRLDSWRAIEEIYKSGRAKSIGVSNFTVKHLQELMNISSVVPTVNQVEFHPFLYNEQIELLEFCDKHNIVVEAYSPLAHGKKTDEEVLPRIAEAHNKSPQQIMIRWCLQHGTVPLPKSSNFDHIKQNLQVYDFDLSENEMNAINELSDGTRTCWNPNDMD